MGGRHLSVPRRQTVGTDEKDRTRADATWIFSTPRATIGMNKTPRHYGDISLKKLAPA